MTLQQLRLVLAIADHGLNITSAARSLHTSQPGVSKQLGMLESELGFQLFLRKGKSLVEITQPGAEAIAIARNVMLEIEKIHGISDKWYREESGTFLIGTTPTQARYVLPDILKRFRSLYPRVTVNIHQGTTEQLANMVNAKQIDFVIATGSRSLFGSLVLLPCYHWNRVIVVPEGHPLAQTQAKPSLAQLAQYPLVTYVYSSSAESTLHEAFQSAGLEPEVAATARDADVIKSCVQRGLGIGIIASMAQDKDEPRGLVYLDAEGLFPRCTTWVGSRKGLAARRYMYDFMALLANHLTEQQIRRAAECADQRTVDAMFAETKLPVLGPHASLGVRAA